VNVVQELFIDIDIEREVQLVDQRPSLKLWTNPAFEKSLILVFLNISALT
jgi:hypothetical protein